LLDQRRQAFSQSLVAPPDCPREHLTIRQRPVEPEPPLLVQVDQDCQPEGPHRAAEVAGAGQDLRPGARRFFGQGSFLGVGRRADHRRPHGSPQPADKPGDQRYQKE
jgi:hypothetical protein